MITRRKLIATAALTAPILLLSRGIIRASEPAIHELKGVAPTFEGTEVGWAPGDDGYRHDPYHDDYQALFGKYGHCSCGTGDCRVTLWRKTKLGSPIGYDVIVNRNWWPLPDSVWMPDANTPVPPALYKEWAHVCAYKDGYLNLIPTIACAMINKKQS